MTDGHDALYFAKQIRDSELLAAADVGVSASQLMQRAAQHCLAVLEQERPAPRRVIILCGAGNNGGDGWVLARLAQNKGYQVTVYAVPAKSELAQQAAQAWQQLGGKVLPLSAFDAHQMNTDDVVVDALLGTGVRGTLESAFCACIEQLNQQRQQREFWVLSVDCPSGLDSDSGCCLPIAVQADVTVTMVALKVGLLSHQAWDHVGRLELADLGIQQAFARHQTPIARCIRRADVQQALPPRARASHKGSHGHVLLLGGDVGMSGAMVLAGRAALRCGAGKVSIATHADNRTLIASAQPEFMVHGVATPEQLSALLHNVDVVVVGPGLGQSECAIALCATVFAAAVPLLVDADGLNLLALFPHWAQRSAPLWLTPHPGEAGRLLALSASEVNADRVAAVRALAQRYQAHTLLKGAGSLIAAPATEQLQLCTRGTPALAVGGSGDVLSGVAGSLIAQQLAHHAVLPVATWLHAVAGEQAAQDGERGTLPSDLMMPLRKLVNP